VLGAEIFEDGIVTRRHTLGSKLTFVDVTCPGPGIVGGGGWGDARGGGEGFGGDHRAGDQPTPNSNLNHFVFLKCWGGVSKMVRPGASIRFSGRVLNHQREREKEAASIPQILNPKPLNPKPYTLYPIP